MELPHKIDRNTPSVLPRLTSITGAGGSASCVEGTFHERCNCATYAWGPNTLHGATSGRDGPILRHPKKKNSFLESKDPKIPPYSRKSGQTVKVVFFTRRKIASEPPPSPRDLRFSTRTASIGGVLSQGSGSDTSPRPSTTSARHTRSDELCRAAGRVGLLDALCPERAVQFDAKTSAQNGKDAALY